MKFALLQLVTTVSAVEVNSGKDKPLLDTDGQTGQTPVVSSDDVIVNDVPLDPKTGLPTKPPSFMQSFTFVAPETYPKELKSLYPAVGKAKEIDVHDGTIWCDETGKYSDGVKTYYWYGRLPGLSVISARYLAQILDSPLARQAKVLFRHQIWTHQNLLLS